MLGPSTPDAPDAPASPDAAGQVSACSVHHQYSVRVSPFQANTGMPRGASGVPSGPTATAAAAWSWVEKMLQLAQRTWAPSATSVSISTAVWVVMCSEPVFRAPRSGWEWANSSRTDMSPGISCSASRISLRPNSASDRSATLNGTASVGMACSFRVAPSHDTPRRYGTEAGDRTSEPLFLTELCKISGYAHHGGGQTPRNFAANAPIPGLSRPASGAAA